MSTCMKKGDKVYVVRDWDRNGTAHVSTATIQSCGKHQVHLLDTYGSPVGQRLYVKNMNIGGNSTRVLRACDVPDIFKTAMEIAKEYLDFWRDHFERIKASSWYTEIDKPMTKGYREAIDKDFAKLHEPRVRFESEDIRSRDYWQQLSPRVDQK